MLIKLPTQCSKVCRFKGLKFWSQDGLIYVMNEKTGILKKFTRKEFLLKLYAINEEIPRIEDFHEREEYQRFVEEAIEICRIAKAQGDPLDPKTISDRLQQLKDARPLLVEIDLKQNISDKDVETKESSEQQAEHTNSTTNGQN